MRWFYLFAGLICVAMAGLHAVLGGIETLNPVMASKVELPVRAAILGVWHGLSLLFGLSALAFFWAFWAGPASARPLGVFLGFFYLLLAGLFGGLSFLWFEDPMVLPQWTILAPIGLFALIASV